MNKQKATTTNSGFTRNCKAKPDKVLPIKLTSRINVLEKTLVAKEISNNPTMQQDPKMIEFIKVASVIESSH